jgi:hypothetical protein
MAFTHALYYPWIDIENTDWLKTAILYWDKISTIVPGYMDEPYNTAEGTFLKQENILIPELVNWWDAAVQDASRNFRSYITTPEAEVLLPRSSANIRIPSINRTSKLARLNKWKIDENLGRDLIESGKVIEEDEWLMFDSQSIDYYMTLLAASLSHEKHFALLTYDGSYEPLADRARRGDNPLAKKQQLGEVLLAKVTLEAIQIAPETPIEALLDFRRDYEGEIGQFRDELGKLSKEIDPETRSLDALQQQVNDIFMNKIEPAIVNLRRGLAGKRILTTATHLSSFIFAGPIQYFEPGVANLVVSAGCEIVGNTVNYLIDRKQQLSEHPYSFILSAQQRFS